MTTKDSFKASSPYAAGMSSGGGAMQMRPSRVLRKLRAGEVVSCSKMNLGDPRVAEIVAASGIDCLWICREHVPNDLRETAALINAAKMYDVDTMVRVPRGSYSDLVHPLEMDAAGIMVPHLMSAEDARRVVWQTRFHPIGRRPMDGGNSDGAYCRVPTKDYIEQANRERFVVVQIEDPEPMEELDAIVAVEGFDMLFFGPGDYSHAIGKPGEINAPEVVKARQRMAAAARKAGKFAGTVGSVETIDQLAGEGFQFIAIGADVLMLVQGYGRIAQAFASRTTL